MFEETITIDIDRLRNDMLDESMGALFAGGFGGGMISALDIECASQEKLIDIVLKQGIDLRKYQV